VAGEVLRLSSMRRSWRRPSRSPQVGILLVAIMLEVPDQADTSSTTFAESISSDSNEERARASRQERGRCNLNNIPPNCDEALQKISTFKMSVTTKEGYVPGTQTVWSR
jgi:hypothetical protein